MVKKICTILGGAMASEQEKQWAEKVGYLAAQKGYVVLTGGRGGVMEAASKGAKKAGGITIAILPGSSFQESPPNPHVDIPIYTGMGQGRNNLNVLSGDPIIAIGGGWGTLSEIALARKAGKKVYLLGSWEKAFASVDDPGIILIHQPEEVFSNQT